ncbi:MAG: hypothetical protein G3M70_05420 [Candidatus Nitronauta litoralis]|uniref:Uncharacterized protein n=1 Tax=Candidatus Nitronauta litoralis TaxID=2705533 RepID=A0A7T0BV10_9BACT|nr:MAG: hypothetical protein G3M70_05420 [Candidatus Nitronauta litoralis]
MPVVCNKCRNYVQQTGIACPVCGEVVAEAPKYTFRDKWREAWELDKNLLPYFIVGFAGLTLIFLFLLYRAY